MAELANENKLGIAKGTATEQAVQANFRGETGEVGLYLAMARQAEREGYPEITGVLRAIAWDEANHAARFAELGGMISDSTRENLEQMIAGETGACQGKQDACLKAKEAGIGEIQAIFDEASRDEARHARALEGLLKRYF
ncbi:MAG: ferritin family protein [Dehalococcoidales bacterium]|jgi:rubrerythrin|nr:rubrerythrin family protein [Dehalococcoidales bacterium]MDP6126754.1 ferritin family protein [Dehalococcoidales bacterium]MDP6501298.1 ferritin family protein [Dehalococcoidales bacterium]MDP6632186.1 ferritin family protein [Dehalococcoidales bacterium]|tara:strand:+ start:241 stop:660 length:420 start_codon:yes stop_codon:yes gene_type:complete